MFSKKPSFDESPLQDLSNDQMSQVAGGCDSYSKNSSWWKKHHHHHHHHATSTTPTTIEVIIKEGSTTKSYWVK